MTQAELVSLKYGTRMRTGTLKGRLFVVHDDLRVVQWENGRVDVFCSLGKRLVDANGEPWGSLAKLEVLRV